MTLKAEAPDGMRIFDTSSKETIVDLGESATIEGFHWLVAKPAIDNVVLTSQRAAREDEDTANGWPPGKSGVVNGVLVSGNLHYSPKTGIRYTRVSI